MSVNSTLLFFQEMIFELIFKLVDNKLSTGLSSAGSMRSGLLDAARMQTPSREATPSK